MRKFTVYTQDYSMEVSSNRYSNDAKITIAVPDEVAKEFDNFIKAVNQKDAMKRLKLDETQGDHVDEGGFWVAPFGIEKGTG